MRPRATGIGCACAKWSSDIRESIRARRKMREEPHRNRACKSVEMIPAILLAVVLCLVMLVSYLPGRFDASAATFSFVVQVAGYVGKHAVVTGGSRGIGAVHCTLESISLYSQDNRIDSIEIAIEQFDLIRLPNIMNVTRVKYNVLGSVASPVLMLCTFGMASAKSSHLK